MIRTITPPLSICANPCLTRSVPTRGAGTVLVVVPFPLPFPLLPLVEVDMIDVKILGYEATRLDAL